MKAKLRSLTALTALLVVAPLLTLAQGPLAPSAPPAPTMKTLVEMEPRTHITSLPYTITASGSYYLTTNLNGGGTAAGLIIQAGGVTIDLRGFSILNCTVGISATAGVKGVAVHNGSVRGCTGAGIDLGAVSKVRLEDVMVCDNGGDGASAGAAAVVTLCTATGNGARGLALGNGGTVFRCVAQSNSNSGIVVTSNCQATENTCTANGSAAGQAGLLTTSDGNRVEGNSCNKNSGHGFQINGAGNLVIRNNACGNTVTDYSVIAGNNYGQILLSPGAAFVNANPWANFGCGTQNVPCQTAADCNDSDPCTTDTCQAGACVHTPIPNCGPCAGAADCNDGNACTTDACVAGACTHTAANCDDNNPCTTDGCEAMSGQCYHTPIAGCGPCMGNSDCNDNNPCTTDACQAGSCVHSPAPNGTACNDGNLCTLNDVCVNGGCTGTPKNCDDGNPCTTDSCDGMTGACVHTAIPNCGTVCGDGIVAGGEQCDDGNLVSGDGCSSTCQLEGCVNGSTQACYTGPGGTLGVGACQAGMQTCNNGTFGPCTGQVTPAPETCNGVDDDCDGIVDDGLGSTTCGTGACQVTVANCVNGQPQVCTPGSASAEVCNGIDDNCDGQVDEGNPGGGVACNTGLLGACAAGTTACSGGQLVCNQNVQPSPEVCDGLDNNCNGVVDDGLGSTTCGTGACQMTVANCVNGQPQVCTPGTASAEVCDGVDNNCNGTVDEGNPGGGAVCNSGLPGVCAAGTTACSSGTIVCIQNVQPATEVCNGLDDDCNGAVDNGNPGGGFACNTGQLGICAPGTTACVGGALVCNRNQNPSAEVCDGLDNNCNGAVDEGNPGGGAACNTGQLGVCAPGTTACVGGAVVCNRNINPSTEVCNGLDDNCDGLVDNGATCAAGQSCVSGACKKNLGVACVTSSECASGQCVDGVCCNTACTSLCVACTAAKKGSGTDGTCGTIAANTDPDNECVLACNGSGACQ